MKFKAFRPTLLAAARAREWIDQQGLSMLIGGVNSAAGLAMNVTINDIPAEEAFTSPEDSTCSLMKK